MSKISEKLQELKQKAIETFQKLGEKLKSATSEAAKYEEYGQQVAAGYEVGIKKTYEKLQESFARIETGLENAARSFEETAKHAKEASNAMDRLNYSLRYIRRADGSIKPLSLDLIPTHSPSERVGNIARVWQEEFENGIAVMAKFRADTYKSNNWRKMHGLPLRRKRANENNKRAQDFFEAVKRGTTSALSIGYKTDWSGVDDLHKGSSQEG